MTIPHYYAFCISLFYIIQDNYRSCITSHTTSNNTLNLNNQLKIHSTKSNAILLVKFKNYNTISNTPIIANTCTAITRHPDWNRVNDLIYRKTELKLTQNINKSIIVKLLE